MHHQLDVLGRRWPAGQDEPAADPGKWGCAPMWAIRASTVTVAHTGRGDDIEPVAGCGGLAGKAGLGTLASDTGVATGATVEMEAHEKGFGGQS
jgi:hypothetical protein